MGTTLQNGVYLPNEGERNCYAGLKTNWEILDQKVADVTALQQAVAGALHREIVESLPTTDIDPNTIYMILSGTSATENVYNEFMYVNNAWELIGTSATDLTNYYTKGDVDGLLLLKANASDLTSHTGDTTIHVTANDKTKWTNSANIVVLRLAKTALTPSSSTNAFSNLDDSTALKVGDKVMDTAGVLFEVTAIDTQNSTFTIGTALIDLAQDSDVVHTNRNDDVSIPLNSTTAELGVTGGSTNITFLDKNGKKLSGIVLGNYGSSKLSYARLNIFDKDANNNEIQDTLEYAYVSNNTNAYLRVNRDNFCALGSTSFRWKGVYATNYYYGSNNVEFSTKFVTTDTNQTISGSKTFSDTIVLQGTTTPTVKTISNIVQDTSANNGYVSWVIRDKDNLNNILESVLYKYSAKSIDWQLKLTGIDNGVSNTKGIRFTLDPVNNVANFIPIGNNTTSLGISSSKWKDVQTYKVNNLEPSSLSLPNGNVSDFIDISSYFSNTGSGDTNSYTASANGWIYLRLGDISSCQVVLNDSSNRRLWGTNATGNVEQIIMPILKNTTLTTTWVTNLTVNVATARFIPCQGNV